MSGRVMGSAHLLTERNIWMKFNEKCSKGSNPSKGSGDMERTQKCYRRNKGRLIDGLNDEGHSCINPHPNCGR